MKYTKSQLVLMSTNAMESAIKDLRAFAEEEGFLDIDKESFTGIANELQAQVNINKR